MRRRLGQRYELGDPIGAGATSTVHLGRLLGTAGFTKLIAIKRPHPHLAADPALRAILLDEARLVSRISHPNVVGVLDVAEEDGELLLVLEYARGATLAKLLAAGRPDPALAIAVVRDALSGLHAAHHARDAKGEPLGLVHRDVTPRNVVATTDGIGKILDFGIAKARLRMSTTREGHVRGSLPYMAPEQIRDEPLGPRTDVYGASAVLWEALTGRRLFEGDTEAAVIQKILDHDVRPPSTIVPDLPASLDAVVLRGLASDPSERFASGLEMALALETCLAPAPRADVASWVTRLEEPEIEAREARIARSDDEEGASRDLAVGPELAAAPEAAATAPEAAAPEVATPEVAAGPEVRSSSASAPRDGRPKRTGTRARILPLVWAALLGLGALGVAAVSARTPLPGLDRSSTMRDTPSVMPDTSSTMRDTSSTMPPTPRASADREAEPARASPAPSPAHAVSAPPVAPNEPAPSTPSASAAVRSTTPARRAPARATAALPSTTPSSARAECAPYYVDDAGVRRFNRECLH